MSLKRIYRVQWKKAPINQDKLAKLYWEEGLSAAEIAKVFNAGRTTVRDHLQKLKTEYDSALPSTVPHVPPGNWPKNDLSFRTAT